MNGELVFMVGNPATCTCLVFTNRSCLLISSVIILEHVKANIFINI